MRIDGNPIVDGSLWSADDASASIRRVWLATPVLGVLMAIAALVIGTTSDAVGVVIGIALAMVNFRTLHNSLKGILEAGHVRAPSGTTMMFVFRWIIVATIAFALYRTGVATLVGMFAGLCAPAAAIGLEAVFQTVTTLRRTTNDDHI